MPSLIRGAQIGLVAAMEELLAASQYPDKVSDDKLAFSIPSFICVCPDRPCDSDAEIIRGLAGSR